MRWLTKALNYVFKNLYSSITMFILFIVTVMFISLSAQYIGNGLSQKLLNRQTITAFFITTDNKENDKHIIKLSQYFKTNPNLKQSRLKVKMLNAQQYNKIKKNKMSIIISQNEEFMQTLTKQEKLAILDRDMFAGSSEQYTVFSQYDEYALITTNYEDIKVYIGYTNTTKHSDKNKILSIFQILNNIVFKKDLEDPNEENWFKPYQKKNKTN